MLKGFTTAIENSNPGYTWDFNEKKLKGKVVGLVLGEEEFLNSSGKVCTRTYVAAVRSVDVIREGKFDVPELKKLSADKVASTTTKPAEPFTNPFADDNSSTMSDPFADSAPANDSNPWDDSDVNPFA